ncbi:response regulator receiver modulated metal dependent phosphohydrolase [Pseudodesulfovibrio mercurii]|uniref:Response regulator receiver modulated metal dependent phosphohydrolase n=1 Tax=Pseudodesulfovibrio mercurii TaxID=641491 RepID=F0JBY1_9BACT|nr:HD domain-containing phosphohydrolase [Pseudodesulfovibrio mercurii]EGB14374.1 response regulator receiver modulated metal dependent phosphohydrolase [Pseudodesulfovibrio mercurii]
MGDREKQTVLVVDDIPTNLDLLVETLKDEYRVLAALNGREALEIVHSATPPDIVLLDVMLPHMDGYTVCREIKADLRSRNIPVIFVTARDQEEDQTRGFEAGGVDYIAKPISPAVVLARVRTHLALHNQNLALERQVTERSRDLYRTRMQIIRRLSVAAEYKDNETGLHIVRMSGCCRALALAAGLDEGAADLIHSAAPMHDVGKIGIPDHILTKPARLDPDEWEIMKTHTTIGAKIIGEHDNRLMVMARRIALTHHERWDGSGYPLGLAGEAIPLEGRIVALADVFDALTSRRPYKEAWPDDRACDYIREERGRHFDAHLADLFLDNLETMREIRANAGEDVFDE